MRIKIELEIPAWTKWLVSGLTMGIVLGWGAARVRADQVRVKTSWQPGDALKAADLNANFQTIQDALNRLKHPDCPEDYTRDTTATAYVVCKKGVDEVVKVGTGGSAFWIDRYEDSVFDNLDATGTQYGVNGGAFYPATFHANGEYSQPLYAISVNSPASQQPSVGLTWYQAQTLCRLSGKHLPTGEEWLAASLGTEDPHEASDGTNGTCLTSGASARSPGLGINCVSVWGAQDMIGNVWEFSAEWYAGTTPDTVDTPQQGPTLQQQFWSADYGKDQVYNVYGAAVLDSDGSWAMGVPAVAALGGSYQQGTNAGRYCFCLYNAPTNGGKNVTLGLRCVVPR